MENIEKVTSETNLSIFENEINFYINFFCESHGIEDLSTAPQNKFYACLMFCYSKMFKDNRDRLKDKTPLKGYINNTSDNPSLNNLNNSNCGRYNYILLDALVDYYLYICTIYDKDPSIWGFSILTGIDNTTITAWGAEEGKLNKSASQIYKKLHDGRESALVGKLTSNKNPVATIAVLNKHYGYNMAGVPTHGNSKQLSAEELPKLAESRENIVNVHNEKRLEDNTNN